MLNDGACENKAFSCPIRLLHEEERNQSGFQARINSSHPPVHIEHEAAQTIFALGISEAGLANSKRCFPEQTHIVAGVHSQS